MMKPEGRRRKGENEKYKSHRMKIRNYGAADLYILGQWSTNIYNVIERIP